MSDDIIHTVPNWLHHSQHSFSDEFSKIREEDSVQGEEDSVQSGEDSVQGEEDSIQGTSCSESE